MIAWILAGRHRAWTSDRRRPVRLVVDLDLSLDHAAFGGHALWWDPSSARWRHAGRRRRPASTKREQHGAAAVRSWVTDPRDTDTGHRYRPGPPRSSSPGHPVQHALTGRERPCARARLSISSWLPPTEIEQSAALPTRDGSTDTSSGTAAVDTDSASPPPDTRRPTLAARLPPVDVVVAPRTCKGGSVYSHVLPRTTGLGNTTPASDACL